MLIGALEPDLALETLGVFLKNLAPPEILSTTSHQCYLGNKYLSHAYLSSFQPCVGCIMAWIYLFCKCCVSCKVLLENIYIANVSKLRWLHMVGVYKIMFMSHLSQICHLAMYCISIPQNALMCNIDEVAKYIPSLWYLLSFSMHFNYLLSLVDSCDVLVVFVFEVH